MQDVARAESTVLLCIFFLLYPILRAVTVATRDCQSRVMLPRSVLFQCVHNILGNSLFSVVSVCVCVCAAVAGVDLSCTRYMV